MPEDKLPDPPRDAGDGNPGASEEDTRLRIIGFRYDFWKFFLGTFLIGSAGVISTCVFKSYELKISSRSAENKYLSTYIQQYSSLIKGDSLHKYDRAAEMFDILFLASKDDDLKPSWDTIRRYFRAKAFLAIDSSARLKQKATDYSLKSADFSMHMDSLKVLLQKAQAANREDQVNSLRIQYSSLHDSVKIAEAQVRQYAALTSNAERYANKVLDATPPDIAKASPNYIILYDVDLYAAPGYFNQVTQGVSINVNDVNEDTETVNMAIEYSPGAPQKDEPKSIVLKIGATSPDIYLGDSLYKASITIKDYASRGFLKKKVVFYHINLQKKTK